MRLQWTKLALQDLNHVREYIATDHSTAADETIFKIGRVIDSLLSYHHLGRVGRVQGTRELVIPGTPYIVPYRVKKDQIEILAVLHGARRWPDNF